MKVGIIGAGTWGKNLIKEFSKQSNIIWCSTYSKGKNYKWVKESYPRIKLTTNYNDILQDKSLDAVVISTPIDSLATITKQALQADKHVFVEKPLTMQKKVMETLTLLAKEKNRILFIGYIYLYHPVFEKIKEIHNKEIIVELHFSWNKYGTFNADIKENLAVHDIAMIKALGNVDIEEIGWKNVYLGLFQGDFSGSIHINRLSNKKNKQVLIVTKKNTYLWIGTKLFKNGEEWELVFTSKKSPLEREVRCFLSKIK